MPYTYTEPSGGVFADAKSEVRYLVQDRTPSEPFSLSDAEIMYELANANQDRRRAAASVAFQMAIRYGQEATTAKSVANTSLSRDYEKAKKTYEGLARTLLQGGAGAAPAPIFTGDTGSGTPQFTLGQFDNTAS